MLFQNLKNVPAQVQFGQITTRTPEACFLDKIKFILSAPTKNGELKNKIDMLKKSLTFCRNELQIKITNKIIAVLPRSGCNTTNNNGIAGISNKGKQPLIK